MGKLLAAFLLLHAIPARGGDLLDDVIFYDVNLRNRIEMGPITPETVRGFEILYASPGAGDVSEIAGHLLLRVKLDNNPQAVDLGIENPNDLVISLLADTEAGKPPRPPRPVVVQFECENNNWFNIVANNAEDESPLASIWQSLLGLSGGFHITMDRQTLAHAIKSYTIEQDRDLLRYRLNLTPEQRTNLVKRLYEVRAGPKPSYFFFSQNCGSVLIRIVAEGIGDENNATFSPLVAPPHSLLGNLVRSGSASRISPALYSYRKEGFIARELFTDFFTELKADNPDLPWPMLRKLNHPRDSVRTRAVAQLIDVIHARPQLDSGIHMLASLVQEKEMIHAHKDLVCEQYTSETTAEARKVQAHIFATDDPLGGFVIDTDELLHDYFGPVEALHATYGTKHTELYRFAFGLGFVRREHLPDRTVIVLDGSLFKQDLGSRSRVAMQRSSAVTLGGLSAHVGDDGIADWQVTALKLRKFRDTLNSVPSAIGSTRGLGLGLTALDVHHSDSGKTVSAIGGVEGLANIISSANYNDFLLLSAGIELIYDDGYELGAPIGLEHLWSFDNAMNWQWRNGVTYDPVSRNRLTAHSSMVIRLGEMMHADLLLRLGADYRRANRGAQPDETVVLKTQLEVNRW